MKFKAAVIKGKGRGKGLGFPTFNLQIPADFKMTAGIYVAQVWIRGQAYSGAAHYGPIPVFAEKEFSLEMYVLDYPDQIDVREVEFELFEYLRPIQNFISPEALRVQIAADVKKVRDYFAI